MLDAALASSGLTGLIDETLSVDLVRRFKTAPEVYALLDGHFPGQDVSFQSSNRWDIAGASLAGLRTVWVNRLGAPEEYPDCPPDRTIRSLAELCEGADA